MNTTADQDALRRAKDKVSASEVDSLSKESLIRALDLSADLVADPDKNPLLAMQAIMIAIAHFVAGSPAASAIIAGKVASAVVSRQANECELRMRSIVPVSKKAKSMLSARDEFRLKFWLGLAWPVCVGLAIVASVIILQPEAAVDITSTVVQ